MPTSSGYTLISGIKVGSDPLQAFDLYIPNVRLLNPTPAIVFIHGNGFKSGSKNTGPQLEFALRMVAQGYICANVNYRLVQYTGSLPSSWPNASIINQFPAAHSDVQSVICYLRANAATYGLDPNNIISYGDSAGANISLMMALVQTAFSETNTFGGQACYTQAAVADSPPCDFTLAMPANQPSQAYAYPTEWENELNLINAVTTNTAAFQAGSPLWQVSPSTKGFYAVSWGYTDPTVYTCSCPPQNEWLFASAFATNGIPNQVNTWTYIGGHVFAGLSLSQRTAISQAMFNWVAQQLNLPVNWPSGPLTAVVS